MPTFHDVADAAALADAEQSLRRFSSDLRMRADADLRHSIRVDGDERFSMLRLAFRGDLQVHIRTDEQVVAAVNSRGRLDWAIGDELGVADVPWLQQPGSVTDARIGAAEEDVVALEVGPLLRFARAMYGEEDLRLRFDRAVPRTAGLARYVTSVIRSANAVAPTEAFESDLVRASLYRAVAAAVLEGFLLHGDPARRARTAEARRHRYRIAAAFLDDHASLPISTADAAQAAGVGTHELTELFVGQTLDGTTPAQYLRRARLAAAHADLARGDPTRGDTVREIAHRWGFPHPGRFAAAYRQRYGVAPRWTLER